jgi:MFS family permease
MMVGSIVVGNISDLFGRKKPFVLSMLILCVFHLVCYFSVNWVMFAIGRIGVGKFLYIFIFKEIIRDYIERQYVDYER